MCLTAGLPACGNDQGESASSDGAATLGTDTNTTTATTSETDTESDSNDTTMSGDGDASTGDGDGDATTGDGDGDATTGDGDGDATTGDGDGDATTGDGDSTTGDGDGDATTGDGDGDATTMTGMGSGMGTGMTGDGDGDGDGDATTGDGDATTGDGDTGDGDTGDGDTSSCGDGVVDASEECDDGANNGNGTSACTDTCTDNVCGDGYNGPGEDCDDGTANGNGQSACKTDCTVTTCGDGYVGGTEECDDMNTTNDDGCDEFCQVEDTQNCGEAQVVVEPTPPNVMLVLDKSLSMFEFTTQDASNNTVSRWNVLWNVVNNVTNAFDGSINFGAQLFPAVQASSNDSFSPPDARTCFTLDSEPPVTVPAGPEEPIAANNAAGVMGAIPVATTLGTDPAGDGATPAYRGLQSAYYHLNDANANDQSLPKYVIFVSDGAANCNENAITTFENSSGGDIFTNYPPVSNEYDTEVETLIAAASSMDNITTYVVGIGIVDYDPGADACTSDADCTAIDPSLECCTGTTGYCTANFCAPSQGTPQDVNAFDEMNKLAVAGGAPQMGGGSSFYDGTDQAALDAAIDAITGQIFTCTLTLNPEPFPIQVDLVTITVDGVAYDTPLASAADCATQDGWYWSNPYSEVTLCGDACDGLKSTGVLDADYGCPGGGG